METLSKWQSSRIETQGTIDVCVHWYEMPTGDSDISLTFVRGWSGGQAPFLRYLLLFFFLTLTSFFHFIKFLVIIPMKGCSRVTSS